VATYASQAVGWGAPRFRPDSRRAAYAGVAAGLLIAGVGSLEHAHAFEFAGAALALSIVAVLVPEVVVALFMVAPAVKSIPALSGFPVDLSLTTAIAVLVAMAARAGFVKGDARPRPSAGILLAPLLAALILLSVMWTPDPKHGMNLALRFETLTMIAFFAPLVLLRSRSELMRLSAILVAFSTAIALTAVQTGSAATPLTIPGSVDEIDLALYSSLGIFGALYLLLTTRPRWRYLWIVPGAVCASTVIQSGSRGVLIGCSAAAIAATALAIARSRNRMLAGAAALLVVVLVVSAGPQLFGPAAQKYQQELFSGNSAQVLGKRNFLLDYGKDIALAHPLGLGISGYLATTGYAYPHNAFLEAADEEGVIGLGLLLALIIAAWRSGRRPGTGRAGPEAVLAATLFLVLVGESMFSTSFTQNRLMFFALGLAFAVPRVIDDSRAAQA
jgi:hypothetical protein